MKKFFVLFKKEIKELLGLKVILPIIVMTIVLSSMGQLIGSARTKFEQPWPLTVIDQDQTVLSKEIIDHLNKHHIQVRLITENDIDKAVASAQQENSVALLLIPSNFEQKFNKNQNCSL